MDSLTVPACRPCEWASSPACEACGTAVGSSSPLVDLLNSPEFLDSLASMARKRRRPEWGNPAINHEDLVQDAAERIVRKAASFDPAKGSVEHYARRVAYNAMSDALSDLHGRRVPPQTRRDNQGTGSPTEWDIKAADNPVYLYHDENWSIEFEYERKLDLSDIDRQCAAFNRLCGPVTVRRVDEAREVPEDFTFPGQRNGESPGYVLVEGERAAT